ncbi:Centromere protein H [Tolypocladium paradoxum]|uniref:Centromere protein H n=1 Tax=Tolypocladium paradoxum TaxID=94208 RepID=A0A2S4LBJ8_9HYPO|nr:Centromere protein H [Tolypocladium paradoxum]
MDDSRDEAMVDGRDDEAESRLPLSSDEQRVLDLYDTLQQLRLEIAIINSQASHQSARTQGSDEFTGEAQKDLLDARASDLLPYVERRDEAAISVAKQASDMGALRSGLTEVQAETTRVTRNNVELTAVLFDLADKVKQKQAGRLDNPRTQSEVARLEGEVKTSRQRWRVMKGVASGVVSGSGVDWARDDELRDIVLDPESED